MSLIKTFKGEGIGPIHYQEVDPEPLSTYRKKSAGRASSPLPLQFEFLTMKVGLH